MIKDTLKRIRKQKGYTQDDVADFLNVKRQTYSSYERGVSLPDIETIKKLTCFFDVSINELAEMEPFEVINEKNNIGLKRLIEKRKEFNLSQAELAEKLGVSQQTISKYENGSREPDNAMLLKLSEFFHVTIDYLLENPIQSHCATTSSLADNQPLSVEEGALLLQEKLKDTPLVNEKGVITKEGADIFATFLINNADMLKKLLDDNK